MRGTARYALALFLASCILVSGGRLRAQEVDQLDQVNTKDGSILRGTLKSLMAGELILKAEFNKELKIQWSQVAALRTAKPYPFHLKDGSRLLGTAEPGPEGKIRILSESIEEPTFVDLVQVEAINPPEKKAVEFKGHLNLGSSVEDGNTNDRSFNLNGEFVANSERQRLTINGYSTYGDDGNAVTSRNARGFFKYDFFVSKRVYPNVAASFEGDAFADLTLRTTIAGGLGLQIIRAGDFDSAPLKGLEFALEAGAGYLWEDRRRGEDEAYPISRWYMKIEWPFIPGRVTFFHVSEVFPSLEDKDDVNGIARTGFRFTIVENFVATLQVNYRWDNTPPPGTERDDTQYLVTLGYTFTY